MASLNGIRSTFLDYFERNDHRVVPSSPLVPRNDPTLMFTNSGMVQFKNLFTGAEHRDYVRAATSQKCVRAGGKHNDLDNVGYTARHHTFFEMLGNFSFGDYFKERAIPLAWDLLTRDFDLPRDKLLVTVYHDDDAAADLWRKVAGLPDERIIRIATSDNFWTMGPTGPCGPCSEIFYDHGPAIAGGPPGSPDEDGDRFVEIWNLVFMQYEQHGDGARDPLPRPSIDTGMGLERVGAVLQGKHDNYDTDLMRALIEAAAHATSSDPDGPGRVHCRVIADHLRSTSFLIADGVLPANDGRGYVLRRIMRRAMRHAHLLGAEDPVMWRLVPALVAQMGQAFPELARARPLIEETLLLEETRFKTTLDRGLRLLDDELDRLPEAAALPGEAAFRLYDTFGFPLDLTQDALREKGRTVDVGGFEAAMAEQKRRARAAWAGSGDAAEDGLWLALADRFGATEFLGYDTEAAEGQILALLRDGAEVEAAETGEAVQIVLNQTPFYAESGGQVGDAGTLSSGGARVRVADTKKRAGLFVHESRVEEGRLVRGAAAELVVEHDRRGAIRAHHSATHLLHEALRRVLGDHVSQRGSLVAPDRLRFDFTHGRAMTPAELAAVETEVNAMIRQNAPVETRLMTPEAAERQGARALFGEKYGDEVRVVAMGHRAGSGLGPRGGTYSLELCGGTHVGRTGDIGGFRLAGETASASGVRRIEALTGHAAESDIRARDAILGELSDLLRVAPPELPSRVIALQADRRNLERLLGTARAKLGLDEAELHDEPGYQYAAATIEGADPVRLRELVDATKSRMSKEGFVLLIGKRDERVSVAVGVTERLAQRVSAVELVKEMTSALGGQGGGGRPEFAQGGGKDPARTEEAFDAARRLVNERI